MSLRQHLHARWHLLTWQYGLTWTCELTSGSLKKSCKCKKWVRQLAQIQWHSYAHKPLQSHPFDKASCAGCNKTSSTASIVSPYDVVLVTMVTVQVTHHLLNRSLTSGFSSTENLFCSGWNVNFCSSLWLVIKCCNSNKRTPFILYKAQLEAWLKFPTLCLI